MRLSRDLTDPRWMYLKAILFVVIGCMAAGLIISQSPTLQTTVLLVLTIWAFARAYYFAFYVIEHYIDPNYRFAGLWSAIRHVMQSRHAEEPAGETPVQSRESDC